MVPVFVQSQSISRRTFVLVLSEYILFPRNLSSQDFVSFLENKKFHLDEKEINNIYNKPKYMIDDIIYLNLAFSFRVMTIEQAEIKYLKTNAKGKTNL